MTRRYRIKKQRAARIRMIQADKERQELINSFRQKPNKEDQAFLPMICAMLVAACLYLIWVVLP